MNGIVTFTITTEANSPETITRLKDEVASLGFGTTLTETESGKSMSLPDGTYACVMQIDDQMEQMKHYYRGLVKIMRALGIKGKYFINLAATPAYVCGQL
jgi:hypothetical protein